MARGDGLLLEVVDYKDAQRWRWVLKDASGNFLIDQEVNLDLQDPNTTAILDLQSHLDRHSSPDDRMAEQKRLIDELSRWIGSKVFGEVAESLSKLRTPVTVRVVFPPEARAVAHLPLELAEVGGKPAALRDLSLVFEVKGSEPVEHEGVGERLRMLAIYSLPTDVSALALRRERYQQMRLIRSIAQTHNLWVELRVLQYGVTRDNLQEALEEGEGWDLIHISGHGRQGAIVLENPDGTMDEVSSEDLADLLSLARGRLKFVTLSSCLSAAATLEETLNWLKIPVPEEVKKATSCFEADGGPMPALAQELVDRLDCAVLAMRYPVGDDFAIKLASELYERLFGKGQPLPRALQLSLREALEEELRWGFNAGSPPLSLATPALFGREAAKLQIKPPKIPRSEFTIPSPGLAYFPDEPERFVGRSGPMIRASSALAVESDKRGVLFHGMAGAGKTACALELAYHHSRSPRFQGFVWYKAPDLGKEIGGALLDLATEMERQLPGFKMVHAVGDADSFRDFLPQLRGVLENNSILVVLDNLESLLTSDGSWRDERWGILAKTLLDQDGFSRTIFTSRRLPKDLDRDLVAVEPIFALSLNESIVLAREMENLGRLLSGKSVVSLEEGRSLVSRTLALVQGHPKLIELADAQAKDPAALERHLGRAAAAWGDEGRLSSFFEEGESMEDAEKFLEVLKGWTQGLSETLSPQARTLFHLLSALEEPDRDSRIVEMVWPNLWTALGRSGSPPGIDDLLGELKALVEVQRLGEAVRYSLHPGVAEAGLTELEVGFRKAVDSEMAGLWSAVFGAAIEGEKEGAGGWVVQAGLRSAPYLMRLGRWDEASTLLEKAIYRDKSSGTAAAVLPMLRRIAEATGDAGDAGVFAKALLAAGRWQEAEAMLRSLLIKCSDEGKFWEASCNSSDLFRILLTTGRFEEALHLAEEMKGYTRKAGLGPWTQLSDEASRLQALNKLGRYGEVLETVEELRGKMEVLTEKRAENEAVEPWNVKEGILDSGRAAALGFREYRLALELNAEELKAKEVRRATDLDQARTAFNDYFPLLALKRYEEAGSLLWNCKEVFERENDIVMIGMVFSALADLKDHIGQTDQAARFEEDALRYEYLTGDTESVSVSHNNLGNYHAKMGSSKSLAHHLASAVIRLLTRSGMLPQTLQNLSISLGTFGAEDLPASFDRLCERVEEVEGVRFRGLFLRMAGPDGDGDEVMQAIIEKARGENS
jgi:tetratricopeptide (TPR) repeat protein